MNDPHAGRHPWLRRSRRARVAVGRRPGLTMLLLAAMSLALSAGFGWAVGFDLLIPRVHDEHVYLLQAHTFAAGRLTNTVPPLWEHFNVPGVLHAPTWQGKFPPGQGLALAAGIWLGHPLIGVYLMTAGMVAAVYWMLRAVAPVNWALVGALLVLMQWGIAGYWAQAYWGGALAATGGALALGGVARLWRLRGAIAAASLAAGGGAVLLMVTRPYEGALLCAAVGAGLAWRLLTCRPAAATWRRACLPGLACVVLGLAGVGTYNTAVTGSPTTMPYALYEQESSRYPVFMFLPVRSSAVEAPNPLILESDEAYTRPRHEKVHTPAGYLAAQLGMLRTYGGFYGGWWILPVVVLMPLALVRSAAARVGAALVTIALAGSALSVWHNPHYVAPFAGALMLGVTAVLQTSARWRLGAVRWGRVVVAGVLLIAAGNTAWRCFDEARWARWRGEDPWQHRARLAAELESSGGRHLVLAASTNIYRDWGYNLPGFERQPVLWARPLAEVQQAELESYFADRWIWEIDPDDPDSELVLRRAPLSDAAHATAPVQATRP